MKKKHILIDANNFMFIAMSVAINLLKKPEDYEVTFKRLFMGMLGKLQRKHGQFSQYYAVWDSKGGSNWRREIDENYKSTRNHDNRERLKATTEYARGIFEENVIPQFQYPATEADDLLHAMAENLSQDSKNDITIVTRDQDLIQAVQHKVCSRVYNPVTKKDMTIPDYDVVIYKCLVGDSSDNIAGLRGVGKKTAPKMMKEGFDFSLIEETYKIIHIPSNPRYQEYLQVTKEFLEGI